MSGSCCWLVRQIWVALSTFGFSAGCPSMIGLVADLLLVYHRRYNWQMNVEVSFWCQHFINTVLVTLFTNYWVNNTTNFQYMDSQVLYHSKFSFYMFCYEICVRSIKPNWHQNLQLWAWFFPARIFRSACKREKNICINLLWAASSTKKNCTP